MKVYAYRIQQRGPRALEDLLERVRRRPLDQRSYQGAESMRLEDARRRNGLWFADFAVPRGGHGPGRMGRNRQIADIRLGEGERFGEDTGFAYDPVTRYLALQYNHSGPREQGIERYLAAADLSFGEIPEANGPEIDRCGYDLAAVLKPDAYARLRGWGIYKSIEMKISVPGAQRADIAAGRSLGSVLRAPLPDGISTITIGMTATQDREGALGNERMRQIIRDAQQLGGALLSAKVRGKRTEADKSDVVDLVNDRVTAEPTLRMGPALRYTQADRWEALGRVLRQWIADGILPRVAR